MTIQTPDGTPAAIRAYGEYGTRDMLATTVARHAVRGTARIYGVSEGTVRAWLLRAGLPTRHRAYAGGVAA